MIDETRLIKLYIFQSRPVPPLLPTRLAQIFDWLGSRIEVLQDHCSAQNYCFGVRPNDTRLVV